MENKQYFRKNHSPLFKCQIGQTWAYVGKSDRPWVYIDAATPGELEVLIQKIPARFNNFALIEDWMVPFIDPQNTRSRELVCKRLYLPEHVNIPKPAAHVLPLELNDAITIQNSHAYGDYTDIEYIQNQLKKGHHAGIRSGDELVAWAITHDDGAIGFLYVKPAFRGKGYAEDITNYLIHKLRKKRLGVYVHIEIENTSSISLAKKVGFVEDRNIRWFTLPIYAQTFDSPLGPLTATANAHGLISLSFEDELDEHLVCEPNEILNRTQKELQDYFSGNLKHFSVPLLPHGTDFQKEVWSALLAIPYGETRSYLEQANMIQNPKAVRAVGGANSKNPIAIIVPCHRVIGKNGTLTGYAGGVWRKEWLLEHEQRTLNP